MSVLIKDRGKITVIQETKELYGGRADLDGQPAYTEASFEYDPDNKGFFIALTDNITDVDGHWSDISFSIEEFKEFISSLSKLISEVEK